MVTFWSGFCIGIVTGTVGLLLLVRRLAGARKSAPTRRQRDIHMALRRELDDVARQATALGDEVLVHRIAVLRAPCVEVLLHGDNLQMYRGDVGRTVTAAFGVRTEGRQSMLRALNRADEHAQTLVVSTRGYQPVEGKEGA